MPSLFLFQGEANPSDITLRDTTAIALGAIATTGSGTTAVSLLEQGILAATASGQGNDAVTLQKRGVLAAATVGQGNVSVVLIEEGSLSAMTVGSSADTAQLNAQGAIAAATTGEGASDITLELRPAATAGGDGIAPRRSVRLERMSQIRPKKKLARRPRRIAIAAASTGGSDMHLAQLGVVGALTVTTGGASEVRAALSIDELLNDDTMIALSLLAAA